MENKNKKVSQPLTLSKRNSRKTSEQAVDFSRSTRFLSLVRSKLAGGKNIKYMFRNIRKKMATEATPQVRKVKCPKCRKSLQEPHDVPVYRCGGCGTVLQAKHWKSQGKITLSLSETDTVHFNDNLDHEGILHLSSGACGSIAKKDESADFSSAAPIKKTYHHVPEADSSSSSSDKRDDHPEADYRHERPVVPSEWQRRDRLPMKENSYLQVLPRAQYYNIGVNEASRNWEQQWGYEYLPRVPFYPMSPSPSSSAYECASPFNASCISTPEQIYSHQWNYFRGYGREVRYGESSSTSPLHLSGEAFDGRYYHWPEQWPPFDSQYPQYRGFTGYNFSESHSSRAATSQGSAHSEHCYPLRSPKVEPLSQKDVNTYVMERVHTVKRHVLPSAGGAPFVTCSYCLELLQLPQGLRCKKQKRYRVRCGSCFGVLEFFLQDKTGCATYALGVLDSKLSKNSAGNVSSHHQDDQDLASDDEEGCPDEGDELCSDNDCEDSVCKSSLSTDDEQFSLENFWNIGDDEDAKKRSRGGSSESETMLRENPEPSEAAREISEFHLEHSQTETRWSHSEGSHYECKNSNTTLELDKTSNERNETQELEKMDRDGSGICLEDSGDENEKVSKMQEQSEKSEERRSASHSEEPLKEDEISYGTHEPGEDVEERHQPDWFFAPSFCVHKLDLEGSGKDDDYTDEILKSDEIMGDRPGLHLEEYEINHENSSGPSRWSNKAHTVSGIHAEETETESNDAGETFEPRKSVEERSEFGSWRHSKDHEISKMAVLETDECLKVGENETETPNMGETTGGKSKISFEEPLQQENMDEKEQFGWFSAPSFGVGKFELDLEESEQWGEILKLDQSIGDRQVLHLGEYESKYENSSGPLNWSDCKHKVSTSHTEEPETESNYRGEKLETRNDVERRSEFNSCRSLKDRESLTTEAAETNERPMVHVEESPMVGENEAETSKIDEKTEARYKFSPEESSEQEKEMLEGLLFHLELLPKEEQEGQRQALEPREAEDETSAFRSQSSPNGCGDSRKVLELDGETSKEKMEDYSEQLQDKNKNLSLPFEPYAHFYAEVDPSKIVGLRQALYPTQSSPLTSPIHTPVGSPLHYPRGSPLHSSKAPTPRCTIVSPLRSPIVSPLQSPVRSQFSLSDALYLGK